MAFNGPLAVDYRNVAALNLAYLSLLQGKRDAGASLRELCGAQRRRITALTRRQAQRLSATPFLLFSLRERDDHFWDRILADGDDGDLLVEPLASDLDRLRSAGLGFVWQLARQNPYTLRLTCGASLHWCERIAERTFFGLLAAASPHPDLLVIRRGEDHELWQKLLVDGISRDAAVRRAAHMGALQTVLTRTATSMPQNWSVAACKTRQPGLRVAE